MPYISPVTCPGTDWNNLILKNGGSRKDTKIPLRPTTGFCEGVVPSPKRDEHPPSLTILHSDRHLHVDFRCPGIPPPSSSLRKFFRLIVDSLGPSRPLKMNGKLKKRRRHPNGLRFACVVDRVVPPAAACGRRPSFGRGIARFLARGTSFALPDCLQPASTAADTRRARKGSHGAGRQRRVPVTASSRRTREGERPL